MSRKVLLLIVAVAALSVLLAGCLPGDGAAKPSKPAGFFWGIWHGWVAPVSLIAEIFRKDIRIYEPANSGLWYDLGYYMAVVSGFGGLSLFHRRNSGRNRRR
ncbi:MAG: hypothetical protein WD024_01600 [Bacillota bacterium]